MKLNKKEYNRIYNKTYKRTPTGEIKHLEACQRYYAKNSWTSYSQEKKDAKNKTRREWRLKNTKSVKIPANLKTENIHLVYETNIKKYETLTCYLCLKPI